MCGAAVLTGGCDQREDEKNGPEPRQMGEALLVRGSAGVPSAPGCSKTGETIVLREKAGITALSEGGIGMEHGKQRTLPQPPPGCGTVSRVAGMQQIVSGERGLGRCNAILSQILSRLSIIVPSWDLAPARGSPLPPCSPPPDAAEFDLPNFPTPEEIIES